VFGVATSTVILVGRDRLINRSGKAGAVGDEDHAAQRREYDRMDGEDQYLTVDGASLAEVNAVGLFLTEAALPDKTKVGS
jgi:hypothetical protein